MGAEAEDQGMSEHRGRANGTRLGIAALLASVTYIVWRTGWTLQGVPRWIALPALAVEIADTRAAMGDEGEETPDLVPLGAFGLKDIREPVELLQVAAPGLDADFPPPRTLDAPDEPPAPGEPPYPGLVPFDEADAGRFFGRDALVAGLDFFAAFASLTHQPMPQDGLG